MGAEASPHQRFLYFTKIFVPVCAFCWPSSHFFLYGTSCGGDLFLAAAAVAFVREKKIRGSINSETNDSPHSLTVVCDGETHKK